MEWAIGGVLGLGALWYFILAMMGSSRPDNLNGFRWKLLGLCLIWPVSIVGLVIILIWKAISGSKTETSAPLMKKYSGSVLWWVRS